MHVRLAQKVALEGNKVRVNQSSADAVFGEGAVEANNQIKAAAICGEQTQF